jgi:nicotinate dehydrogenase subunit B
VSVTRREFMASGGALVVSFSLAPRLLAQQKQESQNVGVEPRKPAPLPGSLKDAPFLDSWIRIDASGAVVVFTGKAEFGQGIKTALVQVAAEELSIDPRRVRLVTADTAETPNEGYTAGSHSMQDSGTAIRHAAAQARELLIAAAAAKFDMPAERLTTKSGSVVSDSGRAATYAELVTGQLLHVEARTDSKLKDPASHTVMGKPLPRIDIPGKLAGAQAYVHDLRLPGMVHARVVRPPSYGARLTGVDEAPAAKLPGVLKIVRDGNFLAVIAEREFQAVSALRALGPGASWEERQTLPSPGSVYAELQKAKSEDSVIMGGPPRGGSGGKPIESTYRRPYQLHGAIGPSCAVGLFREGLLNVWTHSQGVYPLRNAIAEMVRLPSERVRCVHMEGSGCYGHNAADDAAADAALLAMALPDRPVRLQWMREHEHAWEPYGPAMVTTARASLDAGGRIADWQYEVWSNTHSTRPGAAGNLLAAQHLAKPFTPPPPRPLPQPEGGGDRNAIPLYALRNARVVSHFLPDMPLRVSALRSLGAYMNVFSIESFMDELARAAGADPVEFRLRHLEDARAQDVIRMAAERFGWKAWGKRRGRGRGFAFARYKNLGAYAAVAFEVEVEQETGQARVVRAVAAVDSGEAVNPDGIRNQIEGGIIQSLSWTTFESVEFDATRILSRDWSGYPIMRFGSLPDSVEVHVIDRPGQPFLGTGEAAQGPAAACLANAVADATGVRIRELPLSPRRVKAALGV